MVFQDCLEQWLRLNEICPKCRLDAPQESIRRLYFNYTGFSEVSEEENDGKSDCDANSDDYEANCDEFLKKLSDQQIGIYQSESNRKNFGKRLDDLENTLKQLLTELNESVEVINKRESQLFGDTESGGK